jgi:hypothetical protein
MQTLTNLDGRKRSQHGDISQLLENLPGAPLMSGHKEANSHLHHAVVVELRTDLGEAQDAPEVLDRKAMRPEGDDIVFQLGRAHHLGENELGSLRSGRHGCEQDNVFLFFVTINRHCQARQRSKRYISEKENSNEVNKHLRKTTIFQQKDSV